LQTVARTLAAGPYNIARLIAKAVGGEAAQQG
jgi:hypothetical protein